MSSPLPAISVRLPLMTLFLMSVSDPASLSTPVPRLFLTLLPSMTVSSTSVSSTSIPSPSFLTMVFLTSVFELEAPSRIRKPSRVGSRLTPWESGGRPVADPHRREGDEEERVVAGRSEVAGFGLVGPRGQIGRAARFGRNRRGIPPTAALEDSNPECFECGTADGPAGRVLVVKLLQFAADQCLHRAEAEGSDLDENVPEGPRIVNDVSVAVDQGGDDRLLDREDRASLPCGGERYRLR